jgi:hypothetical protein
MNHHPLPAADLAPRRFSAASETERRGPGEARRPPNPDPGGRRPPRARSNPLLDPVAEWTLQAKARLLHGIQNGGITFAQARDAHGLDVYTLEDWWQIWRSGGVAALRARLPEWERCA